MAKFDYQLVDADNHYYEAEDAFTRHGDESVKRYVRWVQEGKRKHLMFGSKLSDTPPNPTFNPIAKAGAFHQRLKDLEDGKGREQGWEFAKSQYGELEPLPDAYRDRDVRLDVLDEQGVEKCFLFPTLGDCVEGLMMDDPVMGHKAFHAYNQWLDEDWGYAYKNRLYAPPYIPMLDPQLAADELQVVLDKGARLVSVRPGPAAGRSPADPVWDPFWSLANEAGILVAYHAYGGRTVYSDAFDSLYGRQPVTDPMYQFMLGAALNGDRGILETTMALVLGNLFGRFPNVRIASVEMGMNWVPYVLHSLDHAGGLVDRHVMAFGARVDDRPSDIFKENVYVSPFPEEDVVGLTEMIGIEHVLFGSDWPHPEGNIEPADYVECIEKLDPADQKKIMRDNALSLLVPR
jgi:predicted TIM-barrel fold metal-dependent hydrolase